MYRFLVLYQIFTAISHFDRSESAKGGERSGEICFLNRFLGSVTRSVFDKKTRGHYARNDILKPDLKNLYTALVN